MTWSDRGFDSCAKLCGRGLRGNTVLHSARTVLQTEPAHQNPVNTVGMATGMANESIQSREL